MLAFFRKIRYQLANNSQFFNYSKYAIGEIVLVVIGILIALQINNWNEHQKSKADEKYILSEVLKNLEEDAALVDDLIQRRTNTKIAIKYLWEFVNSNAQSKDSLPFHLAHLITFERYFPINNAYEILKSNGLQLSDNHLTTEISRYYDYEQKKMSSSIQDIEVSIVKIFNNPNGLMRFFLRVKKDEFILVKDPNDPLFLKELTFFLIGFQDNNGGTLDKLLVFKDINKSLIERMRVEIKELN